ncbi:MAG: hypothetical protein ACYTEZ_17975 [Planctomycetota bacterium]|jgi:hypothetical protein
MRHLCVTVLLSLTCACGGGGGGTGGVSPLQTIGQQVLTSCGAPFLETFLEILAEFEGVLDPNETSPSPIMVMGVDPVAVTVDWSLDLDGDSNPDLFGQLIFVDDQGDPQTAVDVTQLQSGLDGLDLLVPTIPDNTQLNISMAGAPPPLLGNFTITFTGGAVGTVSGVVDLQDPECTAFADFEGASLLDVGGAFPTLTLAVSFVSLDGNAAGSVALDGTDTATADVEVDANPQPTFTFAIDLTTGQVTPVP